MSAVRYPALTKMVGEQLLLAPQEAASRAGLSCARIKQVVRSGALASTRDTGGRYWIERQDFDDWLSIGRWKSGSQRARKALLLAWCAGIIEGEGCMHIARHAANKVTQRTPIVGVSYYSLRLSLGNTDPSLIDPFVRLFGGTRYIKHDDLAAA